jgi:hypothetical protein
MDELIEALFQLSPEVRYVAVYRNGQLASRERVGLNGASVVESDRYEELIVNPTLLTLVGQRGAIDCGGVEFVLIRYGNFFQLVHPVAGGHVSVAIEPEGDPLAVAAAVARLLTDRFGPDAA